MAPATALPTGTREHVGVIVRQLVFLAVHQPLNLVTLPAVERLFDVLDREQRIAPRCWLAATAALVTLRVVVMDRVRSPERPVGVGAGSERPVSLGVGFLNRVADQPLADRLQRRRLEAVADVLPELAVRFLQTLDLVAVGLRLSAGRFDSGLMALRQEGDLGPPQRLVITVSQSKGLRVVPWWRKHPLQTTWSVLEWNTVWYSVPQQRHSASTM